MKHLILLAALLSQVAFAGDGGHGGDAVVCNEPAKGKPVTKFTLDKGSYCLDYVIQLNSAEDPDNLVKDASTKESLIRIQTLLAKKIPVLGEKFNSFIKYVDNHSDFRQAAIWEMSNLTLRYLDDQELNTGMPENCRGQIFQAVIRQKNENGFIDYLSNKFFVSALDAQEFQLSFLYVHEWLWDLTTDPNVIRRINWYLHTKTFASDKDGDVRLTLRNMGLKGAFETYSEATSRKTSTGRTNKMLNRAALETLSYAYNKVCKGPYHWDVNQEDIQLDNAIREYKSSEVKYSSWCSSGEDTGWTQYFCGAAVYNKILDCKGSGTNPREYALASRYYCPLYSQFGGGCTGAYRRIIELTDLEETQ